MPRSGSKLSSRSKRGKRSGKRSRKKSSKRAYRGESDIPYPPLSFEEVYPPLSFEEVENAAKILKITPDELKKFDSTELGAIESFLNTVKKFDPKVYKDELKKKGILYEQEIQKGKNIMLFLQKGKDELGEKLALMEEELV